MAHRGGVLEERFLVISDRQYNLYTLYGCLLDAVLRTAERILF